MAENGKPTLVDGKPTGGITDSGNNNHDNDGRFSGKQTGLKAQKLNIDASTLKNIFNKKAEHKISNIHKMRKIYEKYFKNQYLYNAVRRVVRAYCGNNYSFYLNGCLREVDFKGQVQNRTKLDPHDWELIGVMDKVISSTESQVGERLTVDRRVDVDYFEAMATNCKDSILMDMLSNSNLKSRMEMQKLVDYLNENYIGYESIDRGYSSFNFDKDYAYRGFKDRICSLKIDLKPEDHALATGYNMESEGILARDNGMIFKEIEMIEEEGVPKIQIKCKYVDPVNRKEKLENA